jgi:beta-N-acetylglucosaminidase
MSSLEEEIRRNKDARARRDWEAQQSITHYYDQEKLKQAGPRKGKSDLETQVRKAANTWDIYERATVFAKKDLAKLVREAKPHYSYAQLAELVGTSVSTIQRMVDGTW